MQGVVFRAPFELAIETVADPAIEAPEDAIVRVEVAGVCGSDLHPYRGRERGIEPGTIMGHEFVGEIVEVGSAVQKLVVGERVVAPFSTSCGRCLNCAVGLTARCVEGELFGWIENGRGLHGGQAELVRVPLADSTLVACGQPPAVLPGELALLAGDVLATGLFAADSGEVGEGATVLVVGCGPVGLMAVAAARWRRADRVVAVDPVPERRELARQFGAEVPEVAAPELPNALAQLCAGRKFDAVLEMVGTPQATRSAFDLVRVGGVIAAAGVHTEPHLAFSPGEAYDKNLTYRAGRCSARSYMEEALVLLAAGAAPFEAVISHRFELSGAIEAYRIFEQKLDRCIKPVLLPGGKP